MKRISKRFKAGLSLVLVLGMVLGNVVSARAEVDNRVDECSTDKTYIDGTDSKYTNLETSGDADSASMLYHAGKAETAADQAVQAVDNLVVALDKIGLVATAAAVTGAAASATETANAAETAASAATVTAGNATATAAAVTGAAADYNNKVAADQTAINGVQAESETDVAVAVSEAAVTASEKADEAKELLNIALTGDSADDVVKVNDEEKTVKEVVEMINAAASEAETAYNTASAAAATAQTNLDNAIKEYNKYAATYGKPLYGETEVNYLIFDEPLYGETEVNYLTDGKINNDVLRLTPDELAVVEAQRARAREFSKKQAEVLAANIDDITASVADAEQAVATAKQAAEDAKKLADAAKDVVDGKTSTVEKEVRDGIYLVADKAAAVAKKDSETYASKKSEFESKYNTELNDTDTVASNEIDLQDQKDKKSKAEDAIKEGNGREDIIGLSVGLFSNKTLYEACCQIANEGTGWHGRWANRHYNSSDNVTKAREFKTKYENALITVSEAPSKISFYEAKKLVLQAKEEAETSQKIAETRANEAQARVDAVEANDKLFEQMINNVKGALKEGSDNINQVEYDEDLNAWANTTIDKYKGEVRLSWRIWETVADLNRVANDARTTREWMDDKYNASKVEEIFNYLAITQWAVNTDQREAVMEALISAYRANLAENEKMLATIESIEAESKVDAASKAAVEISENIANLTESINEADAAVSAAAVKINTAKANVATAKAELNAAKAAVSGASLSAVNLEALKALIETAESKLETAQDELEAAEASKKTAELYKAWANELITEQATEVYKWDEDNRANNNNGGSFQLKLQDNKTFTVDYLTLRNYIKDVLQYNEMPRVKALNAKKIRGEEKVTAYYWEVATDENGKKYLTGKYFTSKDELPNAEAEYLVPYQFSSYNGKYHLDGQIVTTEYVEPVVPYTPNYPNNNIVVNNTEKKDDTLVPTLDVPEDETAQSAAANVDDNKVDTEDEVKEMKLDNDLQALGDAPVLAQTGTVPVVVFYFAAVALLLAAIYFKKSFAKEN